MQNEKCKSCFECTETVVVKVRDDRNSEWRDSSVRRCANDQCWHIVGGTREDRLTWISNVYDYKYFGDYELSPEQLAAVYEAKAIAVLPEAKPVCHLVWLQGRRAADDVEDYYEVARPGDKCVDGSDPFPVYASPPALSAQVQDAAGWQPIETAPRDGSSVLGFWSYTYLGDKEPTTGIEIIEWHDGKFHGWKDRDGVTQDGVYTHWMLLPEAPAAPAKQEG